jgi:2-desacetyl-2-hydroxyethyl bacteriochlorophyllide A dehydrogenase
VKTIAIKFAAPSSVQVIELDIPEPGPNDAIVRTTFSGISSGTETLAFRGDIAPDVVLDESIDSLSGTFEFPFRYGYSCVGVVERAAGSLEEGQQVFCMHPHQSVLVRPHEEMLPIEGVEARVATLLPMVETGLQIALDVPDDEGSIFVLGLGVVGLITAAVLRREGRDVTGVEPRADRRDIATALNVPAIDPTEVGGEATTIVECSGRPEVLAEGLDLLAHEGTALVASWYGTKPVELPLGGTFHRRRLTIRSTQVSSIPRSLQPEWSFEKRTEAALSLMKELPLDLLATHTFPVADAQRAFEAADAGSGGLIHAALSYA